MNGSTALRPHGGLRARFDALTRDTLNLFANVLFAVSLFAVWGVLTLIGVVVDQGQDPSVYFSSYPPAVARLVLRLHFDNIYHDAAYVGIIGLILVSLTVCTFKRVIPARIPKLRAVKIEHMPLNATVVASGPLDDVRATVDRFFASRGWSIRKRELGGVEWTFADRHDWARRGVLVAHVGFVIIAIGTTIYWAKGYSGQFADAVAVQTATIPQTGATIALDALRVIKHRSDLNQIGHSSISRSTTCPTHASPGKTFRHARLRRRFA